VPVVAVAPCQCFRFGLAEAFVKTFKRDYVGGAELRDAESVLMQFGGWFADYNTQSPHGALGLRSPTEYRAVATLESRPPSV
jgi:transposase InsO family protein